MLTFVSPLPPLSRPSDSVPLTSSCKLNFVYSRTSIVLRSTSLPGISPGFCLGTNCNSHFLSRLADTPKQDKQLYQRTDYSHEKYQGKRKHSQLYSLFMVESSENSDIPSQDKDDTDALPPIISFDKIKLVHHDECPPWMQKKFISHGYRQIGSRKREILLSAFHWHNETLNVWTHFLAALFFLYLAFKLVKQSFFISALLLDKVFLLGYPLAAATTFLVSTAYHLFMCHNEDTFNILHNTDLQSISLLITASYLPALSIAYKLFPTFKGIYLGVSMLTFPVCSAGVYFAYKKRKVFIKNLMLIISAFWGIIPTVQTVVMGLPSSSFFLKGAVIMWLLYGIGFIFYAVRVPERLDIWKGRVNIIGQSHQFWHIFTIAAALSWYYFLIKYYKISMHLT